MLDTLGLQFGYFPNDCWIIAKPHKKESVEEVFKETNVKIRREGGSDKLTRVSREIS